MYGLYCVANLGVIAPKAVFVYVRVDLPCFLTESPA